MTEGGMEAVTYLGERWAQCSKGLKSADCSRSCMHEAVQHKLLSELDEGGGGEGGREV